MAHRPFRRATSALLLSVTVGAALGACSDQSSPLAPATAAAPTTSPDALLGLPSVSGLVGGLVGGVVDIVGGVVHGVANGLALPKPLNPTAFAAIQRTKAALHVGVTHGLGSVPALSCNAGALAPRTRVIGPAGGTIQIGGHSLQVPAGALDSAVAITASVPSGSALGIDFAPHGLQFDKPVQITFDYTSCTLPSGSYLSVVYSDASNSSSVVLDGMPSLDSASSRKITALTDHFSGYIVAWGRQ